jgi:hypothetical protein
VPQDASVGRTDAIMDAKGKWSQQLVCFHINVAAGPVSRILSAVSGRTVIPLGPALLWGSSDLPGGCGAPSRHASSAKPEGLPGNPSLFGLAPCGVCPARRITAAAVRSYRTFSPLPEPCGPGGMFSVALSVERSACTSAGALPDVIRHTALRSSDFPLFCNSDRPVRLPTTSL